MLRDPRSLNDKLILLFELRQDRRIHCYFHQEKYWFKLNLNCTFSKPNPENMGIDINSIRIGPADLL